ncbi:MAG: glycine betaine ABC transporter substrate-binding protein, partial [Phycisphaeraceae bacterium]|nr:glycine betaine ABC transporter substrate-binding protein [Phycisphaeraceae bacterium]
MKFHGLILLAALSAAPAWAQNQTVQVGSKNFTEQEILGELVAQLIERHTDLTVERKFGLGGTDICHAALLSGELDLYIEYTGTALLNVLKHKVVHNEDLAFRIVAAHYRQKYELEWLPPIGFNNTYALAVRGADADRLNLRSISDLTEHDQDLAGGFTSEFMERPDGYPGLQKTYDLQFTSTVDPDPGLMYKAIADEQVDVIGAFATDG